MGSRAGIFFVCEVILLRCYDDIGNVCELPKTSDSVPQIVTSSLFVTCMWQSRARGIILLGLEGYVTLHPLSLLHDVIDRSVL